LNSDQILGAFILVGSIIGVVVYAVLLYYIPIWTLQVSAFLAVVFAFGILAWIGYTLATTPPPKPIEEVEKEVEEELKKLEAETKETESEAKEEKKS